MQNFLSTQAVAEVLPDLPASVAGLLLRIRVDPITAVLASAHLRSYV